MGVDYSANYGIGIKIKSIDFEDENLDKEIAELECMSELLYDKIKNEKYTYFEVGSEDYGGEENDFYIIIRNPFMN